MQSLPRATRKAIISCLAAAAEAAAPVDDTGWFAQVIARLRTVVSTFHFYGSPNLTADLCKGEPTLSTRMAGHSTGHVTC